MSDTGREFVENFLMHREYDPVKAHEYYMRTRKLKGRKRAAQGEKPLLTRRDRLDRIEARTTKALGPKRDAKVKAIADEARAKLTKITQDLERWVTEASENAKARHDKVDNEMQAKLDALPPIPKGASPVMRAKRAAKMQQIRDEGAAQHAKLNESTRASYEQKRVEVRAMRDKVFSDAKEKVNRIVSRAEK